jgi:WD40 repeat protein
VRLEQTTSVSADGGTISAAAFSPDGKTLATGGELGDLRLLNLPERTVRWQATPSDHWIGVLAFSPDGRRLACRGRSLTLHDATTGTELARIENIGPHGFAWSRDGASYAFASGCNVVVDNGDQAEVRATFEYPVNALDFAPNGDLYIGDNVGRLWRVPMKDGAPELLFDHRQNENDMVRSIAVAWAGDTVFDVPSSGDLRCSDRALATPGATFAFAVATNGRSFAVGGEGAIVRWWRDGGEEHDDISVQGKVAALAFHPDPETLFVSTYDGRQALYTRASAPTVVPPHRARISGYTLSPDGLVLAVCGRAWSLHPLDGRPSRELPRARTVDAGRRDAEFLIGWRDHVALVDARNDAELASFAAPRALLDRPMNAVGPGNLFLIGRNLVDAQTRDVVKLDDEMLAIEGVTDTTRTSDGRWAAGTIGGIEGDLGALLVADATGRQQRVVDKCPINTVAFSPDGRRLFYGCGDGLSVGMGPPFHFLRVRDSESLELLHQVSAPLTCWRFLDEKRALACVGGALQVWSVENLESVETVPLDAPCYSFELSQDRRTLALAAPGEVRVYRLHAQ